ncbi:MAG: hypothetical protein QXI19_03085 [Candidatus Caldarchaeum sp.]
MATGAATGAAIASTGRIVPHPETRKVWPYAAVLAVGLGFIALDKTRAFGVGLAGYGLAKTLLKAVSRRGQQA